LTKINVQVPFSSVYDDVVDALRQKMEKKMVKTILVHVAGTQADGPVLTQAINLVRPFDAHLECLFVRPGMRQLANLVASNATALGVEVNIGEVWAEIKEDAKQRSRKARATFDATCKASDIAQLDGPPGSGLSAAFHEEEGEEADVFVERLRGNDFAVVPGGGVKGGMRSTSLAHLLLTSGRPLILSSAEAKNGFPRTIAIAWKAAPESARAVASSIPLLTKADKVVVLTASEGGYDADEDATGAVISHLRWHGVEAEIREVLPAGRAASEAVLDAVRDVRAELLVMGAYGRSRLSETVFGGFTHRVLSNTELPVFLLH
jgi:nucleotide-binding universal stress UspA family protein